jgi:hypothetical protein
MSLEAWGDEGDGMSEHEHDALTGAGWLDPDDAEKLRAELRHANEAVAILRAIIFSTSDIIDEGVADGDPWAIRERAWATADAQSFITPVGARKA